MHAQCINVVPIQCSAEIGFGLAQSTSQAYWKGKMGEGGRTMQISFVPTLGSKLGYKKGNKRNK